MKKKMASTIMLTLLITTMLTFAFNIQPVKADWTWTETIYIRADGSVYPDIAPISSVDNITYTFTDNIIGDVPDSRNAIIVERDNIVVDGEGYTLQGMGSGDGVELIGRSNVTIKNIEIKSFLFGIGCGGLNNSISGNNIRENDIGISLGGSNHVISGNNITANSWAGIYHHGSNHMISGNNITANGEFGIRLLESSGNSIFGNNVTDNYFGVRLDYSSDYNSLHGNTIKNNVYAIRLYKSSDYNSIFGNIIENNGDGIELTEFSNYNSIFGNIIRNNYWGVSCWLGKSSHYNSISGNNITNNKYAIYLATSHNNNLSGNNITNNEYGIWFRWGSSGNIIYHNNIVDNTQQIYDAGYTNIWDHGYPSGGNYWSDHVTVDDCCGVNQDEPGSDGIVDEPYIIDDYNRDHYPLVEPWSPVISATIDIDPDTLHLMSQGKWITCYIELPESYNVSDIDISTVMVNDTIPVSLLGVPAPEPVPVEIGDYDNDSIPDLMVKFDRAMVSEYILSKRIVNDYVTLTITGEVGGALFEGEDTIRVLMTGGGTRGNK